MYGSWGKYANKVFETIIIPEMQDWKEMKVGLVKNSIKRVLHAVALVNTTQILFQEQKAIKTIFVCRALKCLEELIKKLINKMPETEKGFTWKHT